MNDECVVYKPDMWGGDHGIGEDRDPVYTVYNVRDFLNLKTDEELIYLDPLIRRGSYVMISGSSGVGKTMFLLGLCKSLVNGENFGNWEVKNKTTVLYVDGELPVYLLQKRVKGFNIGEGFHVMSSSVDKDTSYSLNDENFQKVIKSTLIKEKIGVCVFDNISSLTPGLDENSKKDWDPLNQYFIDLRKNGITPILVHHTNKSKTEQRGTSGRTDNIDIWINLEKEDSETLKVKIDYKKWRYEPIEPSKKNRLFSSDGFQWSQGTEEKTLTEKECTILKMLDEGTGVTEIGRNLGISQPYISKMKKKFIDQGFLDEHSKLTEMGTSLL